jgi:site-specific recombinase XerD
MFHQQKYLVSPKINTMKLSILFFPNAQKASVKTGKVPMYMRVTLNRKKAEMRLNIELDPNDLAKWDERTMRFTDREMSENALLNTIDRNFEDFRHHHATSLSKYNVRTIRNHILGLDSKPSPSIQNYIDKYYNTVVIPNTQFTNGTKKNYKKTLKHLKEYMAFRKTKDALISDINMTFAHGFKDYLLGSFPELDRVGMKEPSALDNIKKLRTIFDRAVDEELLLSNPFKKIKLKSKSEQRGRLDINQVRKIHELDLSDFPTQQQYRDIFLFSIFTGLAYADSSTLKQSDFNTMRDGNVRLLKKREKTDVITEQILTKQAVAIMDKYKNSAEREITGNVLPKRSNKELNIQLKILANMVGIPLKLTTHIARHTYRQLLAEADIYEMGVIKRMMGHSRGGEIDGIYYAVTESRLMEAKRKFELYLEKAFL